MTTEISTRKIMSQRKIGGNDLPPPSHERWVVIDFSIILLYFVEIYIHRIHVYKKMACVEWQDEMAKIKEQKL